MNLTAAIKFVDLRARMLLRADASRLYFGYLWWVLEPLLFVALFYLVFGIILQAPRADFLMFLMVGKLPFQWFTGAVNSSASSIVSAQSIISQVNLPKYLFPLTKVHEAAYRQVAVFGLLIVLLIAKGYPISTEWIWLAPLLLAQYLTVSGVALIVSVLVCFARDFSKAIPLFTMGMLFVSGVFWDVRSIDEPLQSLILTFNPMAFLIDAYRTVLMEGAAPDLRHLILLFAALLSINCIAIYWMRRIDGWLCMRAIA